MLTFFLPIQQQLKSLILRFTLCFALISFRFWLAFFLAKLCIIYIIIILCKVSIVYFEYKVLHLALLMIFEMPQSFEIVYWA